MLVGLIITLLAILVCIIASFFLGVAQGQDPKEETQDRNYKGGIAGLIIGIILASIGVYLYTM